MTDDLVGQLFAPKSGREVRPSDQRLRGVGEIEVSTGHVISGAVTNVQLEEEVWRWIRAFHAALYADLLPKNAHRAMELPLPRGIIDSDGLKMEPLKAQHFEFVRTIKKNRMANNVDRITTNNGKLIYECVWDKLNNGDCICVFGLDLNGWKDMGDQSAGSRGCAGAYMRSDLRPPTVASMGSELIVSVPNRDASDPFAE